eukprot:scaffold4522_cov130-Amphora_coffeaeformis.AAC.7
MKIQALKHHIEKVSKVRAMARWSGRVYPGHRHARECINADRESGRNDPDAPWANSTRHLPTGEEVEEEETAHPPQRPKIATRGPVPNTQNMSAEFPNDHYYGEIDVAKSNNSPPTWSRHLPSRREWIRQTSCRGHATCKYHRVA